MRNAHCGFTIALSTVATVNGFSVMLVEAVYVCKPKNKFEHHSHVRLMRPASSHTPPASTIPNDTCFQITKIIQYFSMGAYNELSQFIYALRLPGFCRHSLHGVIFIFGRSSTSVRCAL